MFSKRGREAKLREVIKIELEIDNLLIDYYAASKSNEEEPRGMRGCK